MSSIQSFLTVLIVQKVTPKSLLKHTITTTFLSASKPLNISLPKNKEKNLFVTRSAVLPAAPEPEDILEELNTELHFISMECVKGYGMLEKSKSMLEDSQNILNTIELEEGHEAAINPILVPSFEISLDYTRTSIDSLLMILDQKAKPTAAYIRQICNLFDETAILGAYVNSEYIKVEVEFHSKLSQIRSSAKTKEFEKQMDLTVKHLRGANRTTKQALRVLTNAGVDVGVVTQRVAMWVEKNRAGG